MSLLKYFLLKLLMQLLVIPSASKQRKAYVPKQQELKRLVVKKQAQELSVKELEPELVAQLQELALQLVLRFLQLWQWLEQ